MLPNAKLYVCGDHQILLQEGAFGRAYYSQTGGGYYHECYEHGSHSSGDAFSKTIEIPSLGMDKHKWRRGDPTKQEQDPEELEKIYVENVGTFVHDDAAFDGRKAMRMIPIPKTREVAYLVQLPDGSVLLVDQMRYNFTYDTMRAFIYTNGVFTEEKITDFKRYRDGGTTHMSIGTHKFFWPTPFEAGKAATWDDVPVLRDLKNQSECITWTTRYTPKLKLEFNL